MGGRGYCNVQKLSGLGISSPKMFQLPAFLHGDMESNPSLVSLTSCDPSAKLSLVTLKLEEMILLHPQNVLSSL